MTMPNQERRYTVGIERQEDGSVQAWLHVEPAFQEGMSSESLTAYWFGSREAANWTDEEALAAAVAWGREALPSALIAQGSDEAKAAADELQRGTLPSVEPEHSAEFGDEANAAAVLRQKLGDAETPGFQAEFDPDEAARAGAFVEDALSEADALDTAPDFADAQGADMPVFIERGEGLDVPANVTRANARELLGKRPGESVKDALDRLERQGE
jgi:hypothetical protein